ncbi:MAG: hypothetical protein J0G30_02935 [Actinomycetales bacterium]|nr:hypothetical protein [Actinomycetales bacterium]
MRLDPAHGSLDIAICVAASVENVRVATRRDRSEPWHEVWVGSYDAVPLDAGAWISGADARWDAGATVRERLEPQPGDLLLVEWSGSDPVPWSSGSGEMVIGPSALEGSLWMTGPGMLSPGSCG